MSDGPMIELTEYRIRMSNGEEQIVRGTFAEGTMDSNVFVFCGDDIVAEFYKPLGWFTPPKRKVLGFEAGFNDALNARSQGGQSDEYKRGQEVGSELYRWRAVQTDIDNGYLELREKPPISALTPQREDEVLLADQQDTPPQSNAQASETDAAEAEAVDDALMYGTGIVELMPDGSRRAISAEEYYAAAHPEAERTSVVTDQDRVEQTNTDTVAAVEIPEDDEPKEVISVLTGDPAVEPESGLRGEPLPQSELDSQAQAQAQPQTKSEQSDNPSEEKFNALRDGGDAGFWAAARGLTKIEEMA